MSAKHGKGWRARWLDEHQRRHSQTFKFKRDADLFEQRQKAHTQEIRSGLRAGLPVDHTFDELCDLWTENRASQKRSGDHDASIIRAHLRPAFGKMLVRNVGVAEVDRFCLDRAHLSKKTIANLLTLLVAMLNYAHDVGWLVRVPRIRKPRIRLIDRDFRYLRTHDEIKRFLLSAWEEGPLVHALYATAVYTGMRQGELAGLCWDDVDFDQRLITVQRSFDGLTKADDVRYVPIVDALIPTLREWRLQCSTPVVFPNWVGAMHHPCDRIFREVLHRVLAGAGFSSVLVNGHQRPHITFHALRHTFASHWVMNSGDIFKLQRILGHKSGIMTQRYAHLAPDAFRDDHARFKTITVGGGDVVALSSEKTARSLPRGRMRKLRR
jgi:integrase